MKRRHFIKKAGLAAGVFAGSTILGCGSKESHLTDKTDVSVQPKKTYRWKMVTTWPPNSPLLQDGAVEFARRVKEATDGEIQIQLFAGGELVPPMGVFDAVSDGTVEVGSGAAYYWAGKVPAAQWFATVPFGLNAQGINAWIYSGGGLSLWEEIYAPFNVVPRPGGNTGVQMGGWFRKEINRIDDFNGLKMRIPGLGGRVLNKIGASVVLLPGGEIFTSLERGVIDATEWVGPLHDLRMGFHKAAKYYYYPGWHEPGSVLEIIFNKKAYDALPKRLQTILDALCMESNYRTLCGFEAGNGKALETLITEHKVQLKKFPDEVLMRLRTLSEAVLAEEAQKNDDSKRVHAAFKSFQKRVGKWGSISENTYYNIIAHQH